MWYLIDHKFKHFSWKQLISACLNQDELWLYLNSNLRPYDVREIKQKAAKVKCLVAERNLKKVVSYFKQQFDSLVISDQIVEALIHFGCTNSCEDMSEVIRMSETMLARLQFYSDSHLIHTYWRDIDEIKLDHYKLVMNNHVVKYFNRKLKLKCGHPMEFLFDVCSEVSPESDSV